MMATVSKYRMSFSVGGLMLNESIVIAQAYQPGENWASARERLLAQARHPYPNWPRKPARFVKCTTG